MTELTTMPTKANPGQYVSRVMNMWLSRWWALLVLPFLLCCGLAVIRWEWIVVGLMLMLLVYPSVLAFVYLKYGMIASNTKSISWQQVKFNPESIEITYLDRLQKGDSEEFYYSVKFKENLNPYNVRYVSENSKGFMVRFKTPRYFHIFIPKDRFMQNSTPVDCTEVSAILREYGIRFA